MNNEQFRQWKLKINENGFKKCHINKSNINFTQEWSHISYGFWLIAMNDTNLSSTLVTSI